MLFFKQKVGMKNDRKEKIYIFLTEALNAKFKKKIDLFIFYIFKIRY